MKLKKWCQIQHILEANHSKTKPQSHKLICTEFITFPTDQFHINYLGFLQGMIKSPNWPALLLKRRATRGQARR